MASKNKSSTSGHVENFSLFVRLDTAKVEIQLFKKERVDERFDRESAHAKEWLAAAQVTMFSVQMAASQSHLKTVYQSMINCKKRLAEIFDKEFLVFCRQQLESARDALADRRTGADKTT